MNARSLTDRVISFSKVLDDSVCKDDTDTGGVFVNSGPENPKVPNMRHLELRHWEWFLWFSVDTFYLGTWTLKRKMATVYAGWLFFSRDGRAICSPSKQGFSVEERHTHTHIYIYIYIYPRQP